MIAHINIGSNLGDRTQNIERAVALIAKYVGTVSAVSAPISSEPWGFDSPNSFVNLGVNVMTHLSAAGILQRIKAIEQEIAPQSSHRKADGSYADRCIDIDLIALDNVTLCTPTLQLPHPQMHLRAFVLKPMAEIFPQWQHPTLHATAAQILSHL